MIFNADTFRLARSAGSIKHVCQSVRLTAVGHFFVARFEMFAEIVVYHEVNPGRLHHIVDAFLRQRGLGRDIERTAF